MNPDPRGGNSLRGDKDRLIVREVDGETLVLDTRSDRIHRLNVTASFIFRARREGMEVAGIASAFAARYGVDGATALHDVTETLTKLRALGLLESA
jgi:hypothetical protein